MARLIINGRLRVTLSPLLNEMPIVGAASFSLVDMPDFRSAIRKDMTSAQVFSPCKDCHEDTCGAASLRVADWKHWGLWQVVLVTSR